MALLALAIAVVLGLITVGCIVEILAKRSRDNFIREDINNSKRYS